MLTQMTLTRYKIFHYHHEQKNKKSNFTLFSLLSGQSTVKRKGKKGNYITSMPSFHQCET
jgi:hypothetical protein